MDKKKKSELGDIAKSLKSGIEILLEDGRKILGVQALCERSDIEEGSKLYYELGHYSGSVYTDKYWIPSGIYKEIKYPVKFRDQNDRLNDPDYIKHHNFVLKRTGNQSNRKAISRTRNNANLASSVQILKIKKIGQSNIKDKQRWIEFADEIDVLFKMIGANPLWVKEELRETKPFDGSPF